MRFLAASLLFTATSVCATSLCAQDRDSSIVTFEALQNAARSEFLGLPAYGETSRLQLSDFAREWKVLGPCRSIPELKQMVIGAFAQTQFVQDGFMTRYPRHSISVIRQLPQIKSSGSESNPKVTDLALIYFTTDKAQGLQCRFEFGSLARSEWIPLGSSKPRIIKGLEFDRLMADLDKIMNALILTVTRHASKNSCLKRSAREPKRDIPQFAREAHAYFASHRSDDRLHRRAADQVKAILPKILRGISDDPDPVDLFIVKLQGELPAQVYRYRTNSCVAIPTGFPKPTIVCDESFLSKMETVIRAFENPAPERFTDRGMFEFVKSTRTDQAKMLAHYRSVESAKDPEKQSDEHIGDHLMMALLFVVSHELGHLIACESQYAFQPDSFDMADSSVPNILNPQRAVVKICRHAEQFRRQYFSFGGLLDAASPFEAPGQLAKRFRNRDLDIEETIERRLRSEEIADDYAVELILRYLTIVRSENRQLGLYHEHLIMKTTGDLGLYHSYEALMGFMERVCPGAKTVQGLSVCLGTMDSRVYLEAADIFGDAHRHIVLRALVLMQAIVADQTGYYDRPKGDRTICLNADRLSLLTGEERQRAVWYYGDLQRYLLLIGISDAPLKLASTGCLVGWARQVRERPLRFFHTFYSLESEVSRLRRYCP